MQHTPPIAGDSGAIPDAALLPPQASEAEVDFLEIAGVLWAGKWLILAISGAIILLGSSYVFTLPPIFQADGSVQVDDTQTGHLGGSSDMMASLISGGTVEADAEIEILHSRMILTEAARAMNLVVRASPRYCTWFGSAIARHHGGGAVAKPLLGMDECAWGGERIEVSTFNVPDSMVGRSWTLVATEDGYSLLDPSGAKLLDGKPGVPASADVPDGKVEVFVKTLVARPKTEFWLSRVPLNSVIGNLRGSLVVAELGKQSGVIQLIATGNTPEFVTNFINAVENEYLRQNVERRSAEAQQSLGFLNNQLPDAKAKVEVAQHNLNVYQQQHGSIDVTAETGGVLTQSVAMESRRLELIQQREILLQHFTAKHPSVTALDQQIQVIDGEEAKLKAQADKLPETQQQIFSLRNDLEVSEQLYTDMLNTMQTLQVARAGTVGNVRIVDRPLFPNGPSKPDRGTLMAGVILVALVLSAGTVLIRRMLQQGIQDPTMVENELGLVTYASIPFAEEQRALTLAAKRANVAEPPLAMSASDSSAIEAMRSLRTSLHFAMLEAPNNIVMFTGPSPALGKSFITINLGAVLAGGGKRVLVIDADLRRGQLHRHITGSSKPGLSEVIAGDVALDAVVRATSVPGLSLVSRGSTPPNPAELLLNPRFVSFLNTVSAQFDYVLIDTPPTLAVTDAAIIGGFCGTNFVVLKEGEHSIREIGEVLKRLQRAGVSITGAIFNQTSQRAGYYGYGRYRYRYHSYLST